MVGEPLRMSFRVRFGSTASGAKSQIGAPISAMLRNRTYAAKLADFR